jgi:hypothetical protein
MEELVWPLILCAVIAAFELGYRLGRSHQSDLDLAKSILAVHGILQVVAIT